MSWKGSATAVLLATALLTGCNSPTPPTSSPDRSQTDPAARSSEPAASSPELASATAGNSAPPSAVDSGPDAGASWAAALEGLTTASTISYTIESGFFEGDPNNEIVISRTIVVDRDAEAVQVQSRYDLPAGFAPDAPGDLTMVMVMSPEGAFMTMPGWAETAPEMAGKWIELTPEAMSGAGLPAAVADLDFTASDYFPPPELVDVIPASAREQGVTTVVSGTLPATDAISLLGMNGVLLKDVDAAIALTGAMPVDIVMDASGSFVSAALTAEEHTLNAGEDPTLQELLELVPYASAVLTVNSVNGPVTIDVPAVADRVSDFPG